MSLCVTGIDFAFLRFWNSSDSVVFLFFLFILYFYQTNLIVTSVLSYNSDNIGNYWHRQCRTGLCVIYSNKL
jgi:hypothetical protein